jgi:hypothetical protein
MGLASHGRRPEGEGAAGHQARSGRALDRGQF